MTRQECYDLILAPLEFEDAGSIDAAPADRYALVEVSVFTNRFWVTTHASKDAALTYHDGNEHPEDWIVHQLIDLDTGEDFARGATCAD